MTRKALLSQTSISVRARYIYNQGKEEGCGRYPIYVVPSSTGEGKVKISFMGKYEYRVPTTTG